MRQSVQTSFGFISILFALSAKTYQVDGIVVAIDAARQEITVSHRAIEHYMKPMVMPFSVGDSKELAGIHPGSRIRFDLLVTKDHSVARSIRLVPGVDFPVPMPVGKVEISSLVPDFTLLDQEGRPVTLSELRGKVVVVDFIYTRCPLPDVCPRLSANFATLQRRFQARMGRDLVLLSISIDADYDTPAVLSDYGRRWGAKSPGWRLLTGTQAAIDKVAAAFGLVYWAEEGSLSHTSATSVVDRDGRLTAIVEGSSYRVDQLAAIVSRTCEAEQQIKPEVPQ
jgi:protein SCO1/2